VRARPRTEAPPTRTAYGRSERPTSASSGGRTPCYARCGDSPASASAEHRSQGPFEQQEHHRALIKAAVDDRERDSDRTNSVPPVRTTALKIREHAPAARELEPQAPPAAAVRTPRSVRPGSAACGRAASRSVRSNSFWDHHALHPDTRRMAKTDNADQVGAQSRDGSRTPGAISTK